MPNASTNFASAPDTWGAATLDDVARLYHLLLGRNAEPSVLENPPKQPLAEVVRGIVRSKELRDQVLSPLVWQQPVPHTRLEPEQLQTLDVWMTGRLCCPPLPDDNARPLEGDHPTPVQILARLFAFPLLAQWLYEAHGLLFREAAAALQPLLKAMHLQLEGRIDFVNREYVHGWAMDRSGRLRRLQVEVRCNGRLVATGSAHNFRADLVQHFGGDGIAGFRAPWNPGAFAPGAPIELTLHEASTGQPLGLPYRFQNQFIDQLSTVQLLAREFEDIKRRLDALAGLVPQALSYSAFPLEHYDLYRQVHRVPPPDWLNAATTGAMTLAAEQALERIGFRILIDARSASPSATRLTIDRLRTQQQAPGKRAYWQAGVVGGDVDTVAAIRMLSAVDARLHWLEDWAAAAQWLQSPQAEDENTPERAGPWVLLLAAGELLDEHALAWLIQSICDQPDAALLYWDEDLLEHVDGRLPRRLPRHTDPVLRDAFDPEALLELNIVGLSFAARGSALQNALQRLDAQAGSPLPRDKNADDADAALQTQAATLAPMHREQLLWALLAEGVFLHLPMPLLSRAVLGAPRQQVVDERLSALLPHAAPETLSALLPAPWQGLCWRRVSDPIDPSAIKPLIRWYPKNPAQKLAVIIPTRDCVSLVRDCVTSLLRHALRPNDLDIIIVDNGSVEAETLDYLAEAEHRGELRTLTVDEPFNWSRLNNLAAAATDAQHLLFLNNDTVMLTPEWDDILRGLLERPDVGAVGARLLYEDMTVQHAGVLFGVEGFAAHDGIGDRFDAEDAPWRTQLSRTVRGVTGAFLACTRATFNQVGTFEERQLTVTFNDVEWCLRLSEKLPQHSIVYAPLLSLIHLESKSRGFDYQDSVKQQRAEYERQSLERVAPKLLLRAFAQDASVHSVWARPRKTLR